jgi:3-oxoacyl-[acyl-carrier-protein] synthase II
MLTVPEDYALGIRKCGGDTGNFDYGRWGAEGLREMTPLWMLKYLPNMPASHIAILNDLRGPNNSLTMREAAGNLAIGEAFRTIARGHANRMVAGATGTRILPMQALHALQSEQMADAALEPHVASRPFDADRTGMVAGEGAGMVILEEMETARSRGATIYGEVLGTGSSNVADRQLRGKCDTALANALRACLRDAGRDAESIGHVNAHGLATTDRDAEEARAICETLGAHATQTPVVALKSNFGNLGAGSGVVELIASLLAFRAGQLPRVLNYKSPDPACPLAVVTDDGTSPGDSFVKLAVTPQGQASVLCVGRCES